MLLARTDALGGGGGKVVVCAGGEPAGGPGITSEEVTTVAEPGARFKGSSGVEGGRFHGSLASARDLYTSLPYTQSVELFRKNRCLASALHRSLN